MLGSVKYYKVIALLLFAFFAFGATKVEAAGVLNGQIYYDLNKDNIYSIGVDKPAKSISLRLWLDADNSSGITPGDSIYVGAVSTNSGSYSFGSIPDGQYILDVSSPTTQLGIGQFGGTVPRPVSVTGNNIELSLGFKIEQFPTQGKIKSTIEYNTTTPNGPPDAQNTEAYGRWVSRIGDANMDGFEDIMTSASLNDTIADGSKVVNANRGRVYIHHLNSTGTILSSTIVDDSTANGPVLANGDTFGAAIDSLGDLDNDGVTDILASALTDDTGGNNRGAVYIVFMNIDGTVKSTTKIAHGTTNGPVLADNDQYGAGVANIGDLDNDGVIDIAVGAFLDDTAGSNNGAVYIHFMNTNGTIKNTVKINRSTPNGPTLAASDDAYGIGIDQLGDLDNDGVQEIAVTAIHDSIFGFRTGAIYIHYMNSNGSVKQTVKIDKSTTNGPTDIVANDRYGSNLESLGDLDRDGVADIVVSAWDQDSQKGVAYIHFMNSNGSIKETTKIQDSTPNGPDLAAGDNYGSALALVGDINNDLVPDFISGARADDAGGDYRGAVHLHLLESSASAELSTTTAVSSGESVANNFPKLMVNGVVTATQTVDLVVTGGTAIEGTDYSHTITITIPAGTYYGNVATGITIMPPTLVNNSLIEGNKTIEFALQNNSADILISDSNGNLNTEDSLVYTISNDDFAAFSINHTGADTTVSESGTSDIITISLSAQPISNVVFDAFSADTTEGIINSSTYTFTPADWNTPKQIIVTGVNDLVIDGSQQYFVEVSINQSLTDDDFDLLPSQQILVRTTDNDGINFTSNPSPISEVPFVLVSDQIPSLGFIPTLQEVTDQPKSVIENQATTTNQTTCQKSFPLVQSSIYVMWLLLTVILTRSLSNILAIRLLELLPIAVGPIVIYFTSCDPFIWITGYVLLAVTVFGIVSPRYRRKFNTKL
jgi:hypothetical protein